MRPLIDGHGRAIGDVRISVTDRCNFRCQYCMPAEGKLRTCLFSLNETDLREPLRAGASDAEVEAIVRDAVWRKELKHHIGDEGFVQPARSMSRIGG